MAFSTRPARTSARTYERLFVTRSTVPRETPASLKIAQWLVFVHSPHLFVIALYIILHLCDVSFPLCYYTIFLCREYKIKALLSVQLHTPLLGTSFDISRFYALFFIFSKPMCDILCFSQNVCLRMTYTITTPNLATVLVFTFVLYFLGLYAFYALLYPLI